MEKAMLEKRRTGGANKHEDQRTVHPAQSQRRQALGLGTTKAILKMSKNELRAKRVIAEWRIRVGERI